jgi:aminopeptidase-like protein
MQRLVEMHWRLNRTAVNPETDILAEYLRHHLDAQMVEAKSGTDCLTWTVPLCWRVRKAQLRRMNGAMIADFADNPLHLWTHSVAFNGTVSKSELLEQHIQTDPRRPDEIVYHYRNGYRSGAREWGFSVPYRKVAEMTDPRFEVEIVADLDTEGSLKVVDAFLPGALSDTVFIMAHTCHPALVADGLACIAVAAELFHALKALPERRYSYRFLFGPEYFAAAAYLALAPKSNIQNLRFGMYLDMLSNHEPLGFQGSMQGNSRIDAIARNVIRSHVGHPIEKPYRELWGNDETFYNGPGFEIPTIGVGRGMYREYHYDTDNLENMSMYHMVESAWVLNRICEVLETDYVPVRSYDGPIYLSRYGLYVDPTLDPQGAANLERLQVMVDGRRSCMDIAAALDVDFFFVRNFCDSAHAKGLISKVDRPARLEDAGTL